MNASTQANLYQLITIKTAILGIGSNMIDIGTVVEFNKDQAAKKILGIGSHWAGFQREGESAAIVWST